MKRCIARKVWDIHGQCVLLDFWTMSWMCLDGKENIFEIEFLVTRKDRKQYEEIQLKIGVAPVDEKMRESINTI